METVICPLDGKPCEADCPDCFTDAPEGGCIITLGMELGGYVVSLGNGNFAIAFLPNSQKKAAPGAANTESDRVETVNRQISTPSIPKI